MIYDFSSEKGFTLVELLIVFSIIAILSSAGIAISLKFGQSQSVSAASQNVSSMIFNARSQAQSLVSINCSGTLQPFTGMQIVFCSSKDSNGRSCANKCVANPRPDYEMDVVCGSGASAVKKNLEIQLLPSQIKISPDNCSMLFQPYGAPVVGFGNVSINGFGKTQTITVNQNGVIQ